MAGSCEHLMGLTPKDFPPQKTPNACEECVECRSCGHVGCCDSSPGKHATKHFHETQHPVMRAIPPAAWTWCYVHEAQGALG
jgi:monovalent cation/hydrogen antiporter